VIGTSVQREFLGWSARFLPVAARFLAERHLRGGELRMDGSIVVVPGARAGRRLKELLVEEGERRAVRLVPPRVLTVGELPEVLYAAPLPAASPTLDRRVWSRVLRELPVERRTAIFRSPPPPGDLPGWARLGRIVQSLQDEVTGAGLRFGDVVACCSRGLLFADTERWEVLAAAQEEHDAVLAGLGLGDRGAQRIVAAERGELRRDREIWLCGVAEMPRVVQRMLERLAGAGGSVTTLVHAPASEAGSFDHTGCVLPEAWATRPLPLTEERLRVVGRPADQAREVVGVLASLDGRYAADEIVLAVPDEELLPYLEQRLSEAGVPVHVGQGTPVERTRAARLLEAVAGFVTGRRYEAGAALARHPDLTAALLRATREGGDRAPAGDSLLAALDRHFSEVLPSRLTPAPPAASAVVALSRRLDEPELLGRLRGKKPLSAWAPELLGLLVEVYGGRSLERSRPEHRRLLDSLQVIRRAALELHQLPAPVDEPCDAASAIAILLDEITGGTVAPEPGEAAVELLGWLELHLDDAPVAIVTGFNEHFLPESTGAHAWLPNSLRAALGMLDNERRYARDAYQLTALLSSREEVALIAGRRTATGDPLRPSRLMFAVHGEEVARRVRRFYGEEAERVPARLSASDGERGPLRSRFELPPEPILRADEPIEHLSVSRFRAVLADPYLFALDAVRKLRTLDDSARELDGLAFGNLAHDALEAFGSSAASDSTDAAEIARFLDQVLEELVLERHGIDPLPAVRLQVAQLRARLRAFAAWQARWRADGWRIVAVECRTPDGGVPFPVDGRPFSISGRIDRIDHHPERGWAVLDYKTGDRGETPEDSHRKGRDRDWVDLQLPLYRYLLPAVLDSHGETPFTGSPGDPVHLGYILLPRETEEVGACFAEWGAGVLDGADEQAREVVRFLRRNHFAFDPAAVSPSRAGEYAALLGIGYLTGADAEDGE
jgi:ATP-dependent helicase/nuclease subunit B